MMSSCVDRKRHFRRQRLRGGLLTLAACALFLGGCSAWDTSIGYFNTYYNAKKLFDEAEDEILATRVSQVTPEQAMKARGMEIPEDADPMIREQMQREQERMAMEVTVPSSAVVKLDKVIEKCSRLLVHYDESVWVDDALLLIGKSYHYKHEYTRAERKFQELLDKFPESELRAEAILWLGKTYAKMEKSDLSRDMLGRAVTEAIGAGEPDHAAHAYLEMGKLSLREKNEAQAVDELRKATEFAARRERQTEVYLALGKELENLGRKDDAAKAYKYIIENLDPEKELRFITELNYARLLRESGDLASASNALIDMLETAEYIDYDSKIQLEIANLYMAYFEQNAGVDVELADDAFSAAVEQYTYVDTTFAKTAEATEAYFALGEINEKYLGDYDNAFDNYSKAKSEFPGIPAASQAGERSRVFGEYRKLRRRMNMADTTLFYIRHPDSLALRDSLQAIADSLDLQRRMDEGIDEGGLSEEQKLARRVARRRPHGRNTGTVNPWEREIAQSSQSAKGLLDGDPGGGGMLAGQADYRRINLRAANADSAAAVLSELHMEMGWIMYDGIGNVDSARYYYTLALDGALADSNRPQALYTLATIERRDGNEDLARDYEDRLINSYPQSDFATSIMLARGIQPPPDSTAIMREQYERAAQLVEGGDRQAGLAALEEFARRYPDSEQALRARLAIAMALEESQGDSALAMYKLMVQDHPDSPYSKRGRDILAAITKAENDEVNAKQKEEEQKRKAEEEREKKKREPRLNPERLSEEQLQRMRDSVKTIEKKPSDPTLDEDFPLAAPGAGGNSSGGQGSQPRKDANIQPLPSPRRGEAPENSMPLDSLKPLTPSQIKP